MELDLTYLLNCIATLDKALSYFENVEEGSLDHMMYRSACVKEFEIILEQSGKLLRKILKPYFHSPKAVDKLTFKEVFRNALLRDLISIEECERWLNYRDNRNDTAHDYGVDFAKETLTLLPEFLKDAAKLANTLKLLNNN